MPNFATLACYYVAVIRVELMTTSYEEARSTHPSQPLCYYFVATSRIELESLAYETSGVPLAHVASCLIHYTTCPHEVLPPVFLVTNQVHHFLCFKGFGFILILNFLDLHKKILSQSVFSACTIQYHYKIHLFLVIFFSEAHNLRFPFLSLHL